MAPGSTFSKRTQLKTLSGRRANQNQSPVLSLSFLGEDWQVGNALQNRLTYTALAFSLFIRGVQYINRQTLFENIDEVFTVHGMKLISNGTLLI